MRISLAFLSTGVALKETYTPMDPLLGIEVFTSRNATQLTGISARLLTYWDRTRLVSPSVLGAKGAGSRRVYSFGDVVALRCAARLRALGLDVDVIKTLTKNIQARKLSGSEPIPPTFLIVREGKLLEISEETSLSQACPDPDALVISLHVYVQQVQENARTLLRATPTRSRKSENALVQAAVARLRRRTTVQRAA